MRFLGKRNLKGKMLLKEESGVVRIEVLYKLVINGFIRGVFLVINVFLWIYFSMNNYYRKGEIIVG